MEFPKEATSLRLINMHPEPDDPSNMILRDVRSRKEIRNMEVSGELQLAFIAAYKMFSESPDPEGKKRELKGFSIIFDVNESTVSVTFLAMLPDGLEPTDEVVRSLPVDVTYDISRETHEVLHWNYNR